MAFMSQQRKAELAVEIKKVMPAGWKWSLAVHHHSTLVLTISAAPVDLIGLNKRPGTGTCPPDAERYLSLNEFYIEREYDEPLCATFKAIKNAMMVGNHDRSEPMTDYFDVGWYIDIRIGCYERPFKFVPPSEPHTVSAGTMPAGVDYREYQMQQPTYEELKRRVAELETRLGRG